MGSRGHWEGRDQVERAWAIVGRILSDLESREGDLWPAKMTDLPEEPGQKPIMAVQKQVFHVCVISCAISPLCRYRPAMAIFRKERKETSLKECQRKGKCEKHKKSILIGGERL
ncbi:unnamed protein product [Ostreobium quekettii]|uniref:Uncharacterized protein n=1 Tax=Ostreobium quekettii TaxID=121088 RepID=A0A8S1JER7_9CHLO|nr:unnamed protein product [Ostreobium quekettii]|eukprot:evm.model.scf_52.10 EVM.evm.TU.scf_52.10   scf_52:101139-101480(+)